MKIRGFGSFTAFLVSLLLVLNFFSCSQANPAGSNSGSKNSVKKLMVWHWMTDREDVFLQLAKKYESQTGIKVVFELYAPSDAYSQRVRAAAQAQNLPDIFGILADKRDFASFIKAGHVANLTEEMEKDNSAWKNSIFAKALAVNEFLPKNEFSVEPGIYGAPIDVMNILMLYNKSAFKKAGIDPNNAPKTWQEFIDGTKKLKAIGYEGLASGWAEVWMIHCFATDYAFNIMGQDKVFNTIRGKVPYTDPDWVQVFKLFKQLSDEGVLANGIVSMINKTAEQAFANERAAFAFNGSWCVNVYKGMNPKLDYGIMLPPKVSDKYPVSIWGGAGTSFMINDRSLFKDEAIKFLKWLTEPEQQTYLSKETNNLPSNKNCISDIPPLLADFVKYMDETTHPNIWPVTEYPAVIEKMDKGIQSIIIGEITPEQLSREVQEVKEQEMRKDKK